MSDFGFLAGALVLEVEGMKAGSDRIRLLTDRGLLEFFHRQDCCESVSVEDVVGDPKDLVGNYIRELRVDTNEEVGGHGEVLWTFYNLITDLGDYQIRWYGTSNGYYSVSVDWSWTAEKPPISMVMHPPFSRIREIDVSGAAFDEDGLFVMRLTPEATQTILASYTLR